MKTKDCDFHKKRKKKNYFARKMQVFNSTSWRSDTNNKIVVPVVNTS